MSPASIAMSPASGPYPYQLTCAAPTTTIAVAWASSRRGINHMSPNCMWAKKAELDASPQTGTSMPGRPTRRAGLRWEAPAPLSGSPVATAQLLAGGPPSGPVPSPSEPGLSLLMASSQAPRFPLDSLSSTTATPPGWAPRGNSRPCVIEPYVCSR